MLKLKEKFKDKKISALLVESWSVSWPMTLIMFFIFLIGLTDVYIAGKFGKEIKAAYGLSFQLYFLFLVIAMGITIGSVSVVSRLYTAGRKDEFNEAIVSSLAMTLVIGFVMSVAGFFITKNIIGFFKLPPSIESSVSSFVGIYCLGMLFHYVLINTNGILRACKMVRKSLYTMAIVCITNIALNFYLSFYTPFSYKGIAISTVISLLIGCLLNIAHIKKVVTKVTHVSTKAVKKIAVISWPASLVQILWQLGAIMTFFILSRLPENNIETIAAFTNGLKIESVIFLPAFAFSMANAVVVGNSLGENKKDNAFYGGIVTAIIGASLVLLLTVIVIISARFIATFLSYNVVVIDESVKYLLIALLFEPFMAWGVILSGALNGAGDTKAVLLIVGLSVWLVRIPLSYILGVYFGFGATAIWWSMNASILFYSLFMTIRYFSRAWIKHS